MLKICSNALLLSSVPHFVEYATEIAKDIGVELTVADEWNTKYRLSEDVVICGSKFLSKINKSDYNKVRLILKTNETVSSFVEMGINNFIFDYNNQREFAFSFYIDTETKQTVTVSNIIQEADCQHYHKGKYDFNFKTDKYLYEGIGIYLRPSEKKYLASWLLLQKKDNKKREILYRLRARFGKEFLSDIDRHGCIKEKKNEEV